MNLSIPKWERYLSYSVWIFHSLAAFVISYKVSNGPIKEWIKHHLEDSNYVADSKMDLADLEWKIYRQAMPVMILDYGLNSLGFFLAQSFIPRPFSRYFIILIGIITHIHMTSIHCFMVLFAFTMIVAFLSEFTKQPVVPWILCVSFIIKATKFAPFSANSLIYYREFNIYLYGAIKALNLCLYICKLPKGDKIADKIVPYLLYYFYLPYSMTLIVLFEDFWAQFKEREAQNFFLPSRTTIFFILRIIFWYFFIEAFLHLIFVNSFFNSPYTIINGLNCYEISAIAYVMGQFFHLKYVVIFGVPALFARIDGMSPPAPPICISRVSKYSRMWRHFDVGLHQFLKHQVYIPMLRPKLSPLLSTLRNIGALVAVFSIVIVWHGSRLHYICWVTLSAFELIIEWIGHFISKTVVYQKYSIKIGPINTRRVIALSMLATVIPGIFGVFFFLGQENIGMTIFNNILISGTWQIFTLQLEFSSFNAGFVFLHLITLGYFFNQVCIDLEYHIDHKDRPVVREKKNQ